jgi:MFS family permease
MAKKDSKNYAMRALLTICVTSFCASGITWSTISLYAAPVVEDLGITATQFMSTLTLLVIINAFGSIILYGPIVSKLGIRMSIIIGSMLLAAAQAIWAFSNGIVMLYLGALVMGFGIITITANTQVLVLNGWFTKRGGTYIGIANTVGSVSGMVSAAIYGGLIMSIGWRIPFLVTCGFNTLGLILVIIS